MCPRSGIVAAVGGFRQRRAIQIYVRLIALACLLTTLPLGRARAQNAPQSTAAAAGTQPDAPQSTAAAAGTQPAAAPPAAAVAAPVAQPAAAPVAPPAAAPPTAAAPPSTADRPWRAGMERAPEPVRQEAPLRWYGWQTLLVDSLSIAAFAAGVSDSDLSVFTLVGLGGIVFGSPLVHVLNGNGSSAGISLGIRLGSFLLFGIGGILSVGETLDSDEGTGFGTALVLVGVTGLAVGIILDVAALAWVRAKPNAERWRTNTASIQPWFDPNHGRAGLSFVLAM